MTRKQRMRWTLAVLVVAVVPTARPLVSIAADPAQKAPAALRDATADERKSITALLEEFRRA